MTLPGAMVDSGGEREQEPHYAGACRSVRISPRAAWARVAPRPDRVALAALVVLTHDQHPDAFRRSRVAWLAAMLARTGVDPWPSVHRALAQKERGLEPRPERFFH